MNTVERLTFANNSYCVYVCRDHASLANYKYDWDQLLLISPQRSPLLSYAWISSYLLHRLKANQSWCVLFAYQDDRLLGVLPLIICHIKTGGISRIILRSPDDNHILGGDILYPDKAQKDVFRTLIAAASKITPELFSIELRRVAENSPTINCLDHPGWYLCLRERAGVGYYFPVVGKFETYLEKLSKNLRGNLRRAEAKLNEDTGLRVSVLENDAAVPGDLYHRFTPLEASGWKGREGSAIECSPELLLFYRTLTTRLSESGMLRWEYLERGDELLAANLSMRIRDIVVIWKLGYDEKYGKYSPGGLLFKSVLERAFKDDTISEFNLMSDTPWQLNWNPHQRAYSHIYIYPARPFPILAGFLPRFFKSWLRRSPLLMRIARSLMKLSNKR